MAIALQLKMRNTFDSYRTVISVSFPLVLSMAATTVMEFTDRVFLACFFSGRGKTGSMMVINLMGMAFNIPLDYALINGVWIFPEMGIQGAGIATVCAWTLIALLYCGLIFNRKNDSLFGVLSHRTFDADLSLRIIRTGVPAALQFAMDVFAFIGVLKGAGDTRFIM